MGSKVKKFKKGDRVRYIDPVGFETHNLRLGRVFTVVGTDHMGWVRVDSCQCKGDGCGHWMPERFEKVDEQATPVAVQDFSGSIDGQGIKGVMKSPKTPLDLIPPQFTEGLAEILKHGALKYAPNNWLRGMSWETVMGGILRHLSAFRRGEEMDPESGLPHLHHAACGLAFLSYYAHGPKAEEYRKMDDRVFKEAA